MAGVIRREAVVGPDGRIEISVPELTAGTRVTVTIEVQDPSAQAQKRPAIEILAEARGHQLFKTAEEVDEYIRQERESWEREPGDPRGRGKE